MYLKQRYQTMRFKRKLWLLLPIILASMGKSVLAQSDTLWHTYSIREFNHMGRTARLVSPRQADTKRNWIWRARFWGHEPQVDTSLLSLGFHLAYIDVSDMYGSPAALRIWDSFYSLLTDSFNLAGKVVLEGFSRGGLMVYNWAGNNPEKVACIYADAPVCDITSWPGGKGMAKGSPEDWQKCLKAYGIEENEIGHLIDRPFSHAKEIARAGIPAIHVCGKTDQVVPINENTYLIENIFKEHKGIFKLIEKEGIGHHPHSLENPRPILRFILEHTNKSLITDQIVRKAQPTHHIRSPLRHSYAKFENEKKGSVAFLGGSITYNAGWRDSVTNYLQARFPNTSFDFINAGIPSMGSVPGSFRFYDDVLKKGNIDLLFVEAAVNDATNGRSKKAILRGMEGIVRHALISNKKMDIVMMHFVDPQKMSHYNNGIVPDVILTHERVASYYNISTINLAKEVNDRILNGEFSWKDDFKDLHPSPFGQGVYAKSIIEFLENDRNVGSLPVANQSDVLKRPLDASSYFNGGFLKIQKAKKRKGFQIDKSWSPRDGAGVRSGFVETQTLVGEKPGAKFTLDFEGKAIGILVAAGPDAGTVEYSVDGNYYKSIDLFTRWSADLHLPWLYVLEDELSNKRGHQLILRISEHKNEKSKGHACRIFNFAINP